MLSQEIRKFLLTRCLGNELNFPPRKKQKTHNSDRVRQGVRSYVRSTSTTNHPPTLRFALPEGGYNGHRWLREACETRQTNGFREENSQQRPVTSAAAINGFDKERSTDPPVAHQSAQMLNVTPTQECLSNGEGDLHGALAIADASPMQPPASRRGASPLVVETVIEVTGSPSLIIDKSAAQGQDMAGSGLSSRQEQPPDYELCSEQTHNMETSGNISQVLFESLTNSL